MKRIEPDPSRLVISAEAFQLAPPAPSTLAAVLRASNEFEKASGAAMQVLEQGYMIKGCRSTLNPAEWPRIRDEVVRACADTSSKSQSVRYGGISGILNNGFSKSVLDARDSLRVEAA